MPGESAHVSAHELWAPLHVWQHSSTQSGISSPSLLVVFGALGLVTMASVRARLTQHRLKLALIEVAAEHLGAPLSRVIHGCLDSTCGCKVV